MSEVAPSTPKLDTVLAIGYNSWGRGEDAFEAIQNWKKNVGSINRDMTIHMRLVTADFEIDGMGNLYATKAEKLPDVKLTRKDADVIWGGIDVLHELCYPVDDAVYALEDNGKFKSSEG